jgi:hypothetical protein
VELRLQFQLGINRMVCFGPLTEEPPISTRLELLKQYQHAWRYLQWKYAALFELRHSAGMYEYVGGIFAVGDFQSVSMFQLNPLSHQGKSPLSITWTYEMDLSICEYTTDSTQDLMIMVEVTPPG